MEKSKRYLRDDEMVLGGLYMWIMLIQEHQLENGY
jgi:hypothetical protein